MKTGIKKLDLQGLVTLALFVAMDIVCDGEKFIAIELYRGMLTWGMLTGFAVFACMLVYGKRKYAKTV